LVKAQKYTNSTLLDLLLAGHGCFCQRRSFKIGVAIMKKGGNAFDADSY
jgi:hypothetical protein